MKITKNNWDYIVGLLFTVFIYYISTWESEKIPFILNGFKKDVYLDNFYDNKVKIIFYTSIILIVTKFIFYRFNSDKEKIKEIIKIYFEINDKEIETSRVTIYKEKKGYKIIIKYLYLSFIRWFKEHYKKGIIKIHLKNIPNPFKKYLFQDIRYGLPFKQGSSTYFRVVDHKDDIDGFASYVYFTEKSSSVKNLPNINEINLKDINLNSKNNNSKKVKEYMKKSKVSNIEKLKTMHRFPTNIFATPLIIDNKKQGVIVFDTVIESEKLNYNNFINCARIITSIIK